MHLKFEFYHNGKNNQKKPDIVVKLQCPHIEDIANWSPEKKQEMKECLGVIQSQFEAFKNKLLSVV